MHLLACIWRLYKERCGCVSYTFLLLHLLAVLQVHHHLLLAGGQVRLRAPVMVVLLRAAVMVVLRAPVMVVLRALVVVVLRAAVMVVL